MRKIFLILAAAALMVGSCQASGNKGAAESDKAAVEQSSADELVKRVEDIYALVFSVYALEDSLRNLDELQGSPTWENRQRFTADFCTRELNDLFSQVNEIDSLYHSGELGFFEADYWIMAQDYSSELHVSDVKVLSLKDNEAEVELLINDFGSSRPERLVMIKEDGQWKIDRFIDVNNNIDLKSAMEAYIAENKNTKQS